MLELQRRPNENNVDSDTYHLPWSVTPLVLETYDKKYTAFGEETFAADRMSAIG